MTPPSTEADLRALSEKATPGRWYDQERYTTPGRIWATTGVDDDGDQIAEGPICETRGPRYREDLAFIVACVNYVRSLLASQDHAPSAGAVQVTTDPAWKLVPVEPTEAMLEPCGWSGINPAKPHPLVAHTKPKERGEPYLLAKAYWRAMLAASPPPPEGERYRGYIIKPTDPVPPIPTWRQFAWSYVHEDYDGPEDGRCGHCASPQACREEIDWIEDDQ